MVAPNPSANEQSASPSAPPVTVQAVPGPAPAAKKTAQRPPPPTARINWTCVARTGDLLHTKGDGVGVYSAPEPVVGSYVLDPSMTVASALLASRSSEEKKRPNLEIESITGDIDIDLWILPSSAADGSKAATRVVLKGRNIKLRIHSIGTRPLDLRISCATLSIAIPRDFVGALGINTPTKRIKFSAPVARAIAIFLDADDGMTGYIGDSTKAGANLAQGSRITIDSSKSDVSMSFAKPGTIWRSLWPFGQSAV